MLFDLFQTTLCPSGLQSSLNAVGSLCVVSSREMGLLLPATAESILESQTRPGCGVLFALNLPWGYRFWPALQLSLPSRNRHHVRNCFCSAALTKRDEEGLELFCSWCPQPCWMLGVLSWAETECKAHELHPHKDLYFSMGTSRCYKLFLLLSPD